MTVNIFLAFVCMATVLFRLGDTDGLYIKEYRPSLGIDAARPGSLADLLAFPIFAVAITILMTFFSYRLYAVRKQFAWTLLGMSTLLLILCLPISYYLLSAR
jgi:hypothetical protein